MGHTVPVWAAAVVSSSSRINQVCTQVIWDITKRFHCVSIKLYEVFFMGFAQNMNNSHTNWYENTSSDTIFLNLQYRLIKVAKSINTCVTN